MQESGAEVPKIVSLVQMVKRPTECILSPWINRKHTGQNVQLRNQTRPFSCPLNNIGSRIECRCIEEIRLISLILRCLCIWNKKTFSYSAPHIHNKKWLLSLTVYFSIDKWPHNMKCWDFYYLIILTHTSRKWVWQFSHFILDCVHHSIIRLFQWPFRCSK